MMWNPSVNAIWLARRAEVGCEDQQGRLPALRRRMSTNARTARAAPTATATTMLTPA